jgi:hypothetical protein
MILKNYFTKKITWIISILLIISLPWLTDLALLIHGSNGKTLAAFIEPSLEEILIAGLLQIFFVVIVFATALVTCRPISRNINYPHLVSNHNFKKTCKSLLPVFFFFILYFLLNALQHGVFDVLIAFRSQTEKIGFIGYFAIIFAPIVFAVTWSCNKYYINYLFILLFIIINLLTGFRVLLVNGLILIFIYNFHYFLSGNVKKLFLFIFLLIILLLTYEFYRAGLASGDLLFGDSERSVFDSLARSVPIRYIAISLRDNIVLDWSVLVMILIEPFSILTSLIFPSTAIQPVFTLVSEPMIRSYLVWRGTPYDEPTGFSIHILVQAFLFDGILGIILFAFLLGIFLGVGVKLIQSKSNLSMLLGTLLLSFIVICSESFSDAWKLFFYWMVFLFILVLYARIISIFIPIKNK